MDEASCSIIIDHLLRRTLVRPVRYSAIVNSFGKQWYMLSYLLTQMQIIRKPAGHFSFFSLYLLALNQPKIQFCPE